MSRLLGLLPALLLLAASCTAVQPAAAIVDGRKVAESAIEEELDRVREDPNFRELVRRQGDAITGRVRREVLSQFIRVVFVEVQANRRGLKVSDAQVKNYIADLGEQVGGNDALTALLNERRIDDARLQELARRQIYQDLLLEDLTKDLDVEDATIREAYERSAARYRQHKLQRITVETQEEAERVATLAQDGANFARLARERSIDEAKDSGGDIGFRGSDQLGALAAQIDAVEVGGVVGPVRGSQGFEVYKVVERRTRPIEEVREELRDALLAEERQAAFEQWMTDALRRADIVVNPKYGEFDREALQVVGDDEPSLIQQ